MSLYYWNQHFFNNQNHFQRIAWQNDQTLTEAERKLISSSLQQFQKGEQSEGKHLFSFAKQYADPLYVETIKLFIREEQTHAMVLGRFMDAEKIPRIKHHWVDNVFRRLRKLAGLRNTIIVLVTAEIIAKVYYKALHAATGSPVLRALCEQILRDEDQHIAFQASTLSHLYEHENKLVRWLSRRWHTTLMMGTIIIVWLHHGKLLKAGGYCFLSFFFETMLVFLDLDRSINNQPAVISPAARMG